MNKKGITLTSITIALTAMLTAPLSLADWKIDNNASQVQFISTKKGNIAEVHHFNSLSGGTDDKGQFEMAIDLASVETNIGIRNERINKFLFETSKFSAAKVTAQLEQSEINKLKVGVSTQIETAVTLQLHGESKTQKASLLVTKLNDTTLLVNSYKPVLINASDFSLAAGVEKLRELANLPSISTSVPVTFSLTLKQ